MIQAILLNEEQSSVISQSREPVQVCDPAGKLLGRVITGAASSRSLDSDHWVECWKEWYFETDEAEEAVVPQTATKLAGMSAK
ncbi:MAG TPA: hypothetical protein VHY91_11390 [Pirellulales bacterium]|jgi:hypothetical protein|nr:hypothetical protein [Pirellulales bacterium]HEX4144126.1 hypothetical protein [Pirellulales bacterium]